MYEQQSLLTADLDEIIDGLTTAEQAEKLKNSQAEKR